MGIDAAADGGHASSDGEPGRGRSPIAAAYRQAQGRPGAGAGRNVLPASARAGRDRMDRTHRGEARNVQAIYAALADKDGCPDDGTLLHAPDRTQ